LQSHLAGKQADQETDHQSRPYQKGNHANRIP
jgi:hypothetical protein